MKRIQILAVILICFLSSCKHNPELSIDTLFEKQLQEKFIHAKEGDVIELPEGKYTLTRSLSLNGIKNVTIRGKGSDKTILSFKGQEKTGADGLYITADGVVMEDFAIIDTKGDAIKVQDSKDVTFRRLKVSWSNLHDSRNGSYGAYPVGCSGVLIEECNVSGASGAGIYVGQSKNIVIKKNHLHDNVAGIEMENSTEADVDENLSENNTAGILIFGLPGLPQKISGNCRVFNNNVVNNNTANFNSKGAILSEIPSGTGIIAMATNECDIFNNTISGQNTIGIALLSYLSLQKLFTDSIYDPYCGGIAVHDNKITRGTSGPDNNVTYGKLFSDIYGDKIPGIIYDGEVNPKHRGSDGTIKPGERICIRNNANASFGNMDLGNKGKNRNSDITKFDCSLPALNEVK